MQQVLKSNSKHDKESNNFPYFDALFPTKSLPDRLAPNYYNDYGTNGIIFLVW